MDTNEHECGRRTTSLRSAGFQIGSACELVKQQARSSQSRRDCVLQPRVARNELPWVDGVGSEQPQRGCGQGVATGHNPVGVATCFDPVSQGSSFLATLGFEPESRWDSQCDEQIIGPRLFVRSAGLETRDTAQRGGAAIKSSSSSFSSSTAPSPITRTRTTTRTRDSRGLRRFGQILIDLEVCATLAAPNPFVSIRVYSWFSP